MSGAESKSVDQLVDDLIATGNMNSDTMADLEGFRAQAAAGALEAEDLEYLRALHGRILGSSEGTDSAAMDIVSDPLTAALARAEAAEAEVIRLKALLAANSITHRAITAPDKV